MSLPKSSVLALALLLTLSSALQVKESSNFYDLQLDSDSPRSGGFSLLGQGDDAKVILVEFSASGKLLRTLKTPSGLEAQFPAPNCLFSEKDSIICIMSSLLPPLAADFLTGTAENLTQVGSASFAVAVDRPRAEALFIRFQSINVWNINSVSEVFSFPCHLQMIAFASTDSASQTLWLPDGFGITNTVLRRFNYSTGAALSTIPIGVSINSIDLINATLAAIILSSSDDLTLAVADAVSNTTRKILTYPSSLFPVGSGVHTSLNAAKTIHYIVLKNGGLGKLVIVATPLFGGQPTTTTLNGPLVGPMALWVKG